MLRPAAAALCAALALAGHARAQAADQGVPVVRHATAVYQALSSFQAEFRQHFDDKMMDTPDSRGVLYQEGRSHFAMRFTDPKGDAIVSDGSRLWVYLPSSSPGKVLRFPLQNHPTYANNLLGAFLDNAVDRYRITYLRAEEVDGHMTDVVTMEPIAADMQFRKATVWFDRESALPRKLDIEEQRGRDRILTLSKIQVNLSTPPSIFQCTPPPGTSVVDQ